LGEDTDPPSPDQGGGFAKQAPVPPTRPLSRRDASERRQNNNPAGPQISRRRSRLSIKSPLEAFHSFIESSRYEFPSQLTVGKSAGAFIRARDGGVVRGP